MPFFGAIAHANEPSSSVALEPTHTSEIEHPKSVAVAFRRGIIPTFSASASNSAAPPRAKDSAHSEAIKCALGDVVATFAYDKFVHLFIFDR
ncbi:MAG TPA: hypothetical protein EYO15_02810 [Marine Group III euryarchaeote]|uniref:Uncharacterized protein n=1 Tax=Marine Group III euryarchaeote TaxID=2173149 RepID=A0A7J4CZP5_9ARCH|nr:hypothetical protein [Marine Group III euryarchaeote]